ncbi:MAG: alpha/beta hydrolase [Parvularculaceae bacterium]
MSAGSVGAVAVIFRAREVKRVLSSIFVVLLAIAVSNAAAETTNDGCAREKIEKIEKPLPWLAGEGGDQKPIWPEGLALNSPELDGHSEMTGNGSPLVAGRAWNWATYVTRPTMTIYRLRGTNTGAALVVLPGGGYAAVAMDLEGTEICDWITKEGVTCVILKYRVPQVWRRNKKSVDQRPERLLALEDAQRAMGLLRLRAADYGIDPEKIGVIGFSAGGHLAAELSNATARAYERVDAADDMPSIPDFAILAYPGRIWDKSSPKTSLALNPWIKISADVPPTLLIHAMNDQVDDIRHSVAYGLALNDAGVPVDMRFFDKGCHAFGLRPTSDPITTEWPGMAVQWLRDIGIL